MGGPCIETFFITGRVSSEVVAETRNMVESRPLLSSLSVSLEKMLLEARFFSMRIAMWFLQLRKALSG